MKASLEGGSPFVTDMNIDRAAVRIAGPLTRYTRMGNSGKPIHRNFCSLCGTTVLTEFDVDPQHVSGLSRIGRVDVHNRTQRRGETNHLNIFQ